MKNQIIKSTYQRSLSGFQIKAFSDWQSQHGHWQYSENGKHYIIFKFTDDKKRFRRDRRDEIVRSLTQGPAIKILEKNGHSLEELSDIGNYSRWWRDQFS